MNVVSFREDIQFYNQIKDQHDINEWATSWESLFLPYANNKCADQPAHPCSLISNFVVRYSDSIIPVVAMY